MIINYPKYLFFVLINTLLDIYFIKKVNPGLRDLHLICALEENFNFSYQLTFIIKLIYRNLNHYLDWLVELI